MKIELSVDQVDDVVIHDLKDLLKSFRAQSVRRANGHGHAIFEHDQAEDLKIIKKHIEACKLLLKYYGVKV
jgi:hypothetical protein